MIIYYLLVIFSIFSAACAQMLLKKGALQHYDSLLHQYLNPWVVGGYLIMLGSMILNIFSLSHGVQIKEISIMESLSYFFVPILAFLFFKEQITKQRIIAVAVIIIGIII